MTITIVAIREIIEALRPNVAFRSAKVALTVRTFADRL